MGMHRCTNVVKGYTSATDLPMMPVQPLNMMAKTVWKLITTFWV